MHNELDVRRLTAGISNTKCWTSVFRATLMQYRLEDLVRALSTHGAVMIEELSREWKSFLGVPCGLAQVSVSGKGLNIELFNVGLYTTSLFALRWVIESKERYAAIVKIPEQPVMPAWKDRRISPEQQRLSAFA